MHGDTIEILPIDYAIVFVWNMGERERLNNENLDSDKFPYVSREAPRLSVNVTYAIYTQYTRFTRLLASRSFDCSFACLCQCSESHRFQAYFRMS